MRRTFSTIVVSLVLAFSALPFASPADAVTCFDSAGNVTSCPPVSYTECTGQYGPVSCDPCYIDKQHAAWNAEQPLVARNRYLSEWLNRQSVKLRERRAKIYLLNRKVERLQAKVRRLEAANG